MLLSIVFTQPQPVDHGGVTIIPVLAISMTHLAVGIPSFGVIFELLLFELPILVKLFELTQYIASVLASLVRRRLSKAEMLSQTVSPLECSAV